MQSAAANRCVYKDVWGHGHRSVVCKAAKGGGPWPWSKRNSKAAPPPPPPPPPPQRQPVPSQSSSIDQDLLRTSPKWRKWPLTDTAQPAGSPAGTPKQRLAQQQQSAWHTQQQQGQQQISPEKQRDLLMESTINPKWRWPTFSSGSMPGVEPQQQQPPPPPPPPQQQQQWWRREVSQEQQQQYAQQQQKYLEQQQLVEQQQQQQRWQWPFVGGAFQPTPEDEFRKQLEAMGVDLQGSKARESARQQQKQREQDMLGSFEQLNDREVARYMSQLRKNRLERVQNRQDDEVVGIAGLYLAITLVLLFMAALANLPI